MSFLLLYVSDTLAVLARCRSQMRCVLALLMSNDLRVAAKLGPEAVGAARAVCQWLPLPFAPGGVGLRGVTA